MADPVRWEPSTGSEALYMESVCATCRHDAAYREGTGDSCEIAARMYRELQAAEWICGDDGYPTCTKYSADHSLKEADNG